MKILNKQKVEEVADIWSNNPKNLHPADSYIGKQGFISGVSYAEEELSELAIEFGDFLLENLDLFDNWSRNVTTTGYCFKQFIKERNEK